MENIFKNFLKHHDHINSLGTPIIKQICPLKNSDC